MVLPPQELGSVIEGNQCVCVLQTAAAAVYKLQKKNKNKKKNIQTVVKHFILLSISAFCGVL